MYGKVIRNLEDIGKNRVLDSLFKSALSEIKFNRKSFPQYLISIVLGAVLGYIVVYRSETVLIMQDLIGIINDVVVAFIAIIFGTYAIFQALMTDSVIWSLLNDENNLLNTSNRSFLNLIFLYLSEIILNIVLITIVKSMPIDYCLFSSVKLSNMLAFGLVTIYLSYSFLLLSEMKNFTVNLYQMFNVYNIYRALEILDRKINSQENDSEDD